jgi:hypothetical protein
MKYNARKTQKLLRSGLCCLRERNGFSAGGTHAQALRLSALGVDG